MIQRVQSIILAGVVLLSVALFYFPLSEKPTPEGKIVLFLTHSETVSGAAGEAASTGMMLPIINFAILALTTVVIFLYKNRPLQIKLTMLAGILAGLHIVAVFYISGNTGDPSSREHYLIGTYFIAIQVFLLLFARRFIMKDEQLVRSSERIR